MTTLGSTYKFAFNITVSGPGQYLLVSLVNRSSSLLDWGSTSSKADFESRTWTMIGSVRGLFLTRYISSKAFSFVASAPSPYTVSVGNATSCPFLIIDPKSSRYSAESGTTVVLLL